MVSARSPSNIKMAEMKIGLRRTRSGTARGPLGEGGCGLVGGLHLHHSYCFKSFKSSPKFPSMHCDCRSLCQHFVAKVLVSDAP